MRNQIAYKPHWSFGFTRLTSQLVFDCVYYPENRTSNGFNIILEKWGFNFWIDFGLKENERIRNVIGFTFGKHRIDYMDALCVFSFRIRLFGCGVEKYFGVKSFDKIIRESVCQPHS